MPELTEDNVKHTPGPWQVILSHRKTPHISGSNADNCGLIARCDTRKPESENVGNANLIAAAPDLLEACRAALEIRNTAYQVDANRKIDMLERRRFEERLRVIDAQLKAAIVKAEGGAA